MSIGCEILNENRCLLIKLRRIDIERLRQKERAGICHITCTPGAAKSFTEEKESQAHALAWALSPDSPETVFKHVTILMAEKRSADALVVAETAAKFRSGPAAESLDQLVANLKRQ